MKNGQRFKTSESSLFTQERCQKQELDPGLSKLKKLTQEMADYYQEIGISLTIDGRISMESFSDTYSNASIVADTRWVQNFEKEHDITPDLIGEQLEMLVSIIFTKFAKDYLAVVRATKYDDYHNGFDTFLVCKKTGLALCAIDEVIAVWGRALTDKIDELVDKNKVGSEAKYGFVLKNSGGFQLVKQELRGLPTFYIGLTKEVIQDTLQNMASTLGKKSEQEEKVFKYFVSFLRLGFDRLNLSISGKTKEFIERTKCMATVLNELDNICDTF